MPVSLEMAHQTSFYLSCDMEETLDNAGLLYSREPLLSPSSTSSSTTTGTLLGEGPARRSSTATTIADTLTVSDDASVRHSSFEKMFDVVSSGDGLQIRVLGIPENGAKSRVETQTKLCIQLVTPNGTKVSDWSYLRLNESILARSKLRKSLQRKYNKSALACDKSKVLNLEAKVSCVTDPDKQVRMCAGCVRRERKRAERKKDCHSSLSADLSDDAFERDRDRILLFNCEPFVNFSSGDAILPTRITCYCRHHNERIGFRIRFTMRDHNGRVVAVGDSPPLMITDDHKSNKQSLVHRKRHRVDDEHDLVTPASSRRGSPSNINDIPPYTESSYPLSINETTPLNTFSLPTPAEEMPAMLLDHHHATSHQPVMSFAPRTFVHPVVERLVPSQGPTFGGIEVTILGSGFHGGLTCLFGDQPAVTLCWSPTTLVCLLPAMSQPGPVVVSFKEYPVVNNAALFHYYNPNDQALLELALQVVGLKMTGRLQDAKQVAMEIVKGNHER